MSKLEKLRDLKTEIEHIQKMLEQGRRKLQADFDKWYELILREPANTGGGGAPTPRNAAAPSPRMPAPSPEPARSAWATPPLAAAQPKQPVLTGNRDADDDIMAFYRAKEELAALQAKR